MKILQQEYKIVGFYPYTSSVTLRIYEQSHNRKVINHDEIQEFANKIQEQAKELDIPWDNKIVIELKPIYDLKDVFQKESNIFIGWYDGIINIGLGMYQPDNYTQKYNKFFD